VLRRRLAVVGLADGPGPDRAAGLTLKGFLDGYLTGRADLKRSTVATLSQTVAHLVAHFGADKPLRDIRAGDADEWRLALTAKGLSEATIRRRCRVARQFFRAAHRKGFLPSNPSADLKANLANPAREFCITREVAQKVLDACPDAEWRLIFALARYGGLRCPSEVLGLTWADIHWEQIHGA
jgi:integrase